MRRHNLRRGAWLFLGSLGFATVGGCGGGGGSGGGSCPDACQRYAVLCCPDGPGDLSACISLCQEYQQEAPQETAEGMQCLHSSATCNDTFACSIPADLRAAVQCGSAPGTGGATGNGATGNGATGNGATGNGATGNGATGNGATGNGAESGTQCTNTCQYAADGECDDGGPGSLWAECQLGTDCIDCGPR